LTNPVRDTSQKHAPGLADAGTNPESAPDDAYRHFKSRLNEFVHENIYAGHHDYNQPLESERRQDGVDAGI